MSATGMKVAIVTGSTRGIGAGIAKALVEAGYRVVFSGTRPTHELTLPDGCCYIGCDVSQANQRQTLIEETLNRYGRLDVLVNNAGVAPLTRMDLLETTEESFDRVLGINLKGMFFLSQLAARAMLACKARGLEDYAPRIVNVSSISAYTASINRGEYCVSKAGIAMVTQLFADRLAGEGIPVFEIRPGIIETDMTQAVHAVYEKRISEGVTPIRRFGTPQDVANAVLAACSGLLDFTTGQVLNADGGFHLRRL